MAVRVSRLRLLVSRFHRRNLLERAIKGFRIFLDLDFEGSLNEPLRLFGVVLWRLGFASHPGSYTALLSVLQKLEPAGAKILEGF
jgi:hypothetical protein